MLMTLRRLCATTLLALPLMAAPAAAWEPTKPVEIVVAAGAGGASDQMARMIQAAVQKNNLMKQPMVVSLKGGASGAEALIYMKGSEGDAHKFLIAYSLIYTLPLSAKIPFDWRDLSPVALVALDQFVLWTNAGLPYKSVKEFTDAAKTANPVFKMGGTGSKREDHILTVFMEKKTGAKFNYLPYKSGGDAATQLDVEYTMLRAMFLPGKVNAEQTAFYVDLFKRLSQTPEFKDYMEKQALKPAFTTGPDLVKFLEKDEALHKQLMTEAGFVASN
jgi:tripartite-type tricarboxylate transporter receptor subunit TctC